MSKCLVTGGLGFIGAHLVDRLRADGHDITILDIEHLVGAVKIPNQWPYVECDIRYINTLNPSLAPVDVVFHLAAVSRTPPAIADPRGCNQTNVVGTLQVFEFARKHGSRVVHSSSNVVYGTPTPYRTSKLAAEMYATDYNTLYNGNIICLRYSNVIGPRLRRGDPAVLSSLRDCCDRNGYVEVTGDGEQTRNFTYVDDIVEANLRAAFSPTCYRGILDITTGVQTTMNEFASYFDCPVRYVEDRKGDTKHIHQHPFEALNALGWMPKVRFDEAMKRSLAWRPE